jgi:serine/threonine protein phosphatase 1
MEINHANNKKAKTFVLGDCHGGYKALKQVFERSGFDYNKDQLIFLGDVVDGWPETPQCIEELLKIKNLILIEGNHDDWCYNWFKVGASPVIWTEQGGRATINSYIANPELMIKHRDFFDRAVKCYVDDKMRVFVHGGFKLGIPIEEQPVRYLTWDRDLYDNRNNTFSIEPYTEAFIGHTSTWNISKYPFCRNKVWFLDQGAGWEGRLTIMDIDSHKFWQSDRVANLYPGFHGR